MRIIIADHHLHALRALKTVIQEKTEIEVVGDAIDADHLIKLAEELHPDFILIDMALPGRLIEDLINDLHDIKPVPTVIIMSTKPEYGRMMLTAGADAFVSKSDQPEWLLETLKKYEVRSKRKGV